MSSNHRNSRKSQSKLNLNVVPFKRRPPMAKRDFTVEHHGSIVLLRPNTQDGIDWANENIGKDNGYQPYWPTVVFEPRYLDQYIAAIQRDGLVAR